MKRLILLAAVVYVLPKVQPTWPGMVVRCEQPVSTEGAKSLAATGSYIPCKENRCACNWECEYGPQSEPINVNGNQTVHAIGCAAQTVITPVKNNIGFLQDYTTPTNGL